MSSIIAAQMVMAIMVAYVARMEYVYIFKNVGLPLPLTATNAQLTELSIKTIFDVRYGELQAFMHPIMMICMIITQMFIFHNMGIYSKTATHFSLFCIFIVSLHIVVPYYFNYLKNYEKAILRNLTLKDWLYVSMREVYAEKTKAYKAELPKDSKIINKLTKFNLTDEDLKEYNMLVVRLAMFVNKDLELFTEEDLKNYIPFFTGYNIFVKDKEGNYYEIIFEEEDEVTITPCKIVPSNLGLSFYEERSVNVLIASRVFEIALFFLIVDIIVFRA